MNESQYDNRDPVGLLEGEGSGDFASRGFVSEIKSRWKQGHSSDAQPVLSDHPAPRAEKSVILDQAYEEYCTHLEAGGKPDTDEFCARFPTFKSSLRRLIETHRFLDENSQLLSNDREIQWPGFDKEFQGFALRRELGRGAFARVYLATEPALGNRRVAIKVSLEGGAEAETLGRVNHPNIVPVHSVREDKESGMTTVCMPYLGGATLCDVLDHAFTGKGWPQSARAILDASHVGLLPEEPVADQRPPDAILVSGTYIDGVIHLGAQLARALAHIHAMAICHRDLKPSNVLLSPDGRPMLLDFNLSFDEQNAESRLGGTLPYMSPEQLQATDRTRGAERVGIDGRSDIFSLGMILFELLSGKHAFGPVPVKASTSALRQHLLERQRGGPRCLRETNPQIDKFLASVIERCLAYEPEKRFQSAAELAKSLHQCLSRWRRLRRWSIVHPRQAVCAASLAMTLFLGGSMGFALRAPYPERQLGYGMEAFRKGDYAHAVDYLNRANIDSNADALMARARANLKLDNLDGALADFEIADQLKPTAEIKGYLGYCHYLSGGIKESIKDLKRAVEGGFESAEIYNNLGLSCWKYGDYKEAKRYLAKAIKLNPTLQAAYLNRAIADMNHCGGDSAENPFPYIGLADIQEALRLGPPSSELHSTAYRLFAMAAALQPTRHYAAWASFPPDLLGTLTRLAAVPPHDRLHWINRAVENLDLAFRMGCKPEEFSRTLSYLQGEPTLQALLAQLPLPQIQAPPTVLFLDPFKGE